MDCKCEGETVRWMGVELEEKRVIVQKENENMLDDGFWWGFGGTRLGKTFARDAGILAWAPW